MGWGVSVHQPLLRLPGLPCPALHLAQEAPPAPLWLGAREEGDRLPEGMSSEQSVKQQEATLLEGSCHVAEDCGWVPKGGGGTVAHNQVSCAQAAWGRAHGVPLAQGHVMLLQLVLGSPQDLRVAVSGRVVQLQQGLGVEQLRDVRVQAAVAGQHLGREGFLDQLSLGRCLEPVWGHVPSHPQGPLFSMWVDNKVCKAQPPLGLSRDGGTSTHLHHPHPQAGRILQDSVHTGLERWGLEKTTEQGVFM